MIKFLKNLFKKSVQNGIEDQTYKIFKGTRLHPPIPKGEEESFYRQCRDLVNNSILDRIIDEVVGEYAEEIIQIAESEKVLLEKRNRMLGADEIRKRLIKHSQMLAEKESFNPHEPI